MAYVLSNDTAAWLDRQRRTMSSQSTPRRGWIFDGENEVVRVCRITGGDPLTGYTATAYPSMAALRDSNTMGTAVTIYPVEIGLDAALPQGTIVLCHTIQCAVTGGSENAEPEEQEES